MADDEESTSFVTQYLQTRGPEMASVHTAFSLESSFNESKLKYEAKGKHEEFMEALQEYGRLEGRKLEFNPVDCSWADVFKELEKAEDAAAASAQGDKRFLTSRRRKLSIISQSVMPLLDAIPDELCVLHGGLAVIFHLAQNRERVRQNILDTFEDIPGIIAMACSKSLSFPEDLKLHYFIDDLKLTLFDAVPSLIEVLMPGRFLAKVTSLFRGFRIQDILDCIQRKANAVEGYSRTLQDGLAVENYLVTQSVHKTTNETQLHIEEIHQGVVAMDEVVRGIDDRCQKFDSNFLELKEFISAQINDALASKNGMFQMLKDVVSAIQYDEQECMPDTNQVRKFSRRNSSPEQLMAILHVPLDLESRDLNFVLKQSREFDTNSKSYGAIVIANPRFQNWLAAKETGLLYVEGQLDSSRFGRTSPISYFCANLAQLFKASSRNIVLHFFCGQHLASNDDMQGPRGLMRSLLAQLLQHWNDVPLFGISFADFNDGYESISTEDLCQMFELLLKQVPKSSTIFFIVDDLAKFEKERWDEDYWHFLSMLGSLVMGQQTDPRFKVLIASATKSKRLQEQIPEELVIQMTERDRLIGHGKQQFVFR